MHRDEAWFEVRHSVKIAHIEAFLEIDTYYQRKMVGYDSVEVNCKISEIIFKDPLIDRHDLSIKQLKDLLWGLERIKKSLIFGASLEEALFSLKFNL